MSPKHCSLYALVCSGGCTNNALKRVAYEQCKFISHSLDSREPKIKALADGVSAEAFFLVDSRLSPGPCVAEGTS